MMFMAVIEGQGRLAALRFGGDGDELKRGGKPPVNHVTIIAQQAQPVRLDANGEGTITLPIGDFNGELRLMAQARRKTISAAAKAKSLWRLRLSPSLTRRDSSQVAIPLA